MLGEIKSVGRINITEGPRRRANRLERQKLRLREASGPLGEKRPEAGELEENCRPRPKRMEWVGREF